MSPTAPHRSASAAPSVPGSAQALAWRVHLLRRDPCRLPALLLVVLLAVFCVWGMFNALLPALAAALLLMGATSEYLFPITYRLTAEGIVATALTSRSTLRWKEVRRCYFESSGLVLTPLPTPSRLDAFRGVLLRFAPNGEPGDRTSTLAAIRQFAPILLDAAAP